MNVHISFGLTKKKTTFVLKSSYAVWCGGGGTDERQEVELDAMEFGVKRMG